MKRWMQGFTRDTKLHQQASGPVDSATAAVIGDMGTLPAKAVYFGIPLCLSQSFGFIRP